MAATKKKDEAVEAKEPRIVVQHMGIPEGELSPEDVEWLKAEHPTYAGKDEALFHKLAKENNTPKDEEPEGDGEGEKEPAEPEAVVIAKKAMAEVLAQPSPPIQEVQSAADALKAALEEAQKADEAAKAAEDAAVARKLAEEEAASAALLAGEDVAPTPSKPGAPAPKGASGKAKHN